MKRWLFFLIMIAIGFGAVYFVKNLIGGKGGDISFSSLREDYRTDYVLMVAESYNHNKNLAQAITRLGELDDLPPTEIVKNAIEFAKGIDYNPNDITQMQLLLDALLEVQPDVETPTP